MRFACGVTTRVCRVRWELSGGASRSQLPLALRWALSVHKAQGMSLDAVEVSLSRAWECGMAYVALSRARSLEGLALAERLTTDALRAHPAVRDFYARLDARAEDDEDGENQAPGARGKQQGGAQRSKQRC